MQSLCRHPLPPQLVAFAVLLGALFLLIAGAGPWSVARIPTEGGHS